MACSTTSLGCVDEESTATISVTFDDSAGTLHTPSAVKWSLSDSNGAIVNSRENVDYSGSLASTISITISGDDLALPAPQLPARFFSVYATVGGLPWRKEYSFTIRNAQVVTT